VRTKWVCPPGTQRFCKIDADSSHSVKNVTRVESPLFPTWLEALTRVTLSLNFRSTNETEVIIYEILEVYKTVFASAAILLLDSANLRLFLMCRCSSLRHRIPWVFFWVLWRHRFSNSRMWEPSIQSNVRSTAIHEWL